MARSSAIRCRLVYGCRKNWFSWTAPRAGGHAIKDHPVKQGDKLKKVSGFIVAFLKDARLMSQRISDSAEAALQ